jgi:cell division protein FtsQ
MSEQPAFSPKLEKSISILFLLVVCAGLLFGAFALHQWMQDEQKVPIRQITILGNTEYLDNEALVQHIQSVHTESFFATDVDAVYATLMQQPWVYQASVRKKWPDTLIVFVVEQAPLANWNADQLVNRDGVSFSGNIQIAHLPDMFGPNGSEKTALAGLQAMQRLLAMHELEVSSLLLTERFAWQVELTNGITLNLGRQEFIARVQRFVSLYPLLMETEQSIQYVDLRYDTGAAVRWRTAQVNAS